MASKVQCRMGLASVGWLPVAGGGVEVKPLEWLGSWAAGLRDEEQATGSTLVLRNTDNGDKILCRKVAAELADKLAWNFGWSRTDSACEAGSSERRVITACPMAAAGP